ncbi:hypothetical protein NKJ35_27200 [Mesorhizobium sp. M0136]|uniref:hypothetical protein n=1 Tax=Mesorhizobium sp. M0136 TaxID=2956890 RepID=UPI0033373B6E
MSETETLGVNEPGARIWADVAHAWLNVLLKILVSSAVIIAILYPDFIPLLKRFGVRSSEINILGSKVQIVDLALSGSAVKLTQDGRMLIAGVDANAIPDRLAQLEQTGRDLRTENDKLKGSVQELQALVATAKSQLDEANNRLRASSSSPLETRALDTRITKTNEESAAQVASATTVAAQASKIIAEPDMVPAVGYGVVIGADATTQAAMDEVRKAQSSVANPFLLFKRQGYWRSVALFGTRAYASDALPKLKYGHPDAYIVDISRGAPNPSALLPQLTSWLN